MKRKSIYIFILCIVAIWYTNVIAQVKENTFTIARVKYSGGGDWYNNPSCIPNLLTFLSQHTDIETAKDEVRVSILDESLFSYPVLFMTGHGRINFTPVEVKRLRTYLTGGGFLYADDDYGMDPHFRREIAKVFPDNELIEIPFSHNIFHNHFNFENGLPKIHEFDGGPPEGYGIFYNNRLVVFYSANTNISDGWADPNVHGDSPQIRETALKMGVNIIIYALLN